MNKSTQTSLKKPITDVKCTRTPGDSLEFLLLHLFSGRHEVLKEYLCSNYVPQSILDVCLQKGIESLSNGDRKNVPHIAQSLRLLLEFGANWKPNIVNTFLETWIKPYLNLGTPKELQKYRKTLYHAICKLPGDYHEVLDLLIAAVGPVCFDKGDSGFQGAMVLAVMSNNIGCVRTLLMNGAHPSSCFNSYFSLLSNHRTLKIPHKSYSIILSDILNVLVSSEFDVNEQYTYTELSPLMYAAATGNIESIRTLIQKNAKFDLVDSYGDTVWKWAVFSRKVDVLECLYEHASSCPEEAVLHWAVIGDHMEMVQYLFNKEITVKKFKQDVQQLKQEKGNPMYSDVIKRHNDYTAIRCSIKYRNEPHIVACFIRSGADLSVRSYDKVYGNVLLFEAAVLYHNHCAAEMLLLSGCSCGVYSTQSELEDEYDMTLEMKKLMNSWKVRENRVKSRKITCRTAILNHLSPTIADDNLSNLLLPDCLIRYLGIPELDDVIRKDWMYHYNPPSPPPPFQ